MKSSSVKARKKQNLKLKKKIQFIIKERKKKLSFFADIKPQFEQKKRKLMAKFDKPMLISKSNNFRSQNAQNLPTTKIRYLNLELLM